jgi:hypothetical protein
VEPLREDLHRFELEGEMAEGVERCDEPAHVRVDGGLEAVGRGECVRAATSPATSAETVPSKPLGDASENVPKLGAR